MTSQALRSLGMPDRKRALPPGRPPPMLPGTFGNPAILDDRFTLETITEAWADAVLRSDPALERACSVAAGGFAKRCAAAISANGGFLVRNQSAAVSVLLDFSSPFLLLNLLNQLSPARELAALMATGYKCFVQLAFEEREAQEVLGNRDFYRNRKAKL